MYVARPTGVRSSEWESEYVVLLYRFGPAGFLLLWLLWSQLLVRSVLALSFAANEPDRMIGIVALVAVTSTVVTAMGTQALMDPSRMTIVILLVAGMIPAIGDRVPVRLTARLVRVGAAA